jgi:uncharacterized protein
MVELNIILLMSLIVVIAYIIKATTGFGEGTFMVPLLLLFLDIKLILPIAAVLFLVGDLYLVYHTKSHVSKEVLHLIVLGGIIGIITGTYLLVIVSSEILKTIFGVFAIIYAIKMILFRNSNVKRKLRKGLGVFVGFLGGVSDALFGAPGPVLIGYLDHLKLNKSFFRGTLTMAFLTFSISKIISYGYSGFINIDIILTAIYLIPAMIIGTFAGLRLHNKINEVKFKQIASVLLLVIGITLLI